MYIAGYGDDYSHYRGRYGSGAEMRANATRRLLTQAKR